MRLKMKNQRHIQKIILSIAIITIGCSNVAQTPTDNGNGECVSSLDYISLYETAYIDNREELVIKSDSMLAQKRFPFCYELGHAGAIDFYCTSNNHKREILQMKEFTQSYISSLYRIDCNKSTSFVTLVSEDVVGCYYCIVVPFDNSTMYVSDWFLFNDEMGVLTDISLNDNYSSILFICSKEDTIDGIDSLYVSLDKRDEVIVFE